jgi:hypothetical protein
MIVFSGARVKGCDEESDVSLVETKDVYPLILDIPTTG